MHATAIVTDHADPPAAHASAFGICRQTFADRNVDMPVESARADIPVRQLEAANVDPAAICLPDAYVDEFKPDSSGLVPGIRVLQHGGKGGNRTDRRSGGQHQQGGTGR